MADPGFVDPNPGDGPNWTDDLDDGIINNPVKSIFKWLDPTVNVRSCIASGGRDTNVCTSGAIYLVSVTASRGAFAVKEAIEELEDAARAERKATACNGGNSFVPGTKVLMKERIVIGR